MNFKIKNNIFLKKYSFEYLGEGVLFFEAFVSFFIILKTIKRELENIISICMYDVKKSFACYLKPFPDVCKSEPFFLRGESLMLRGASSMLGDESLIFREESSILGIESLMLGEEFLMLEVESLMLRTASSILGVGFLKERFL